MMIRGALAIGIVLALAPAAEAVVTCSARTPAAITLAAAPDAEVPGHDRQGRCQVPEDQAEDAGQVQARRSPPAPVRRPPTQTKIEKPPRPRRRTRSPRPAATTPSRRASPPRTPTRPTTPSSRAACCRSTTSSASWSARTATAPPPRPGTDTGKERADCVKEISKQGVKFLDKALKHRHQVPRRARRKLGTAGDLAPICVGSFSGGWPSCRRPTPKTASELAKLHQQDRGQASPRSAAEAATLGQIASIFACPGATTVADLQSVHRLRRLERRVRRRRAAVRRERRRSSPTGRARCSRRWPVTAAAARRRQAPHRLGHLPGGGRIVTSATTSQLVGCGGATDDRPRIIPPVAAGHRARHPRRQRRRPALPEPRLLRPEQRPHLRRQRARASPSATSPATATATPPTPSSR